MQTASKRQANENIDGPGGKKTRRNTQSAVVWNLDDEIVDDLPTPVTASAFDDPIDEVNNLDASPWTPEGTPFKTASLKRRRESGGTAVDDIETTQSVAKRSATGPLEVCVWTLCARAMHLFCTKGMPLARRRLLASSSR
jgi:hypothetical protein